jgi:hypothetical protein
MSVTPVVGGWIRVRKRDGVRLIFPIFFYRVLNSPHRETPKNVMFVCKTFELPSLRNTRNRDKTKKVDEKLSSNFLSIFGKGFDMDFLPKYFCGVFELPLPRNPPKRTKKKSRKKKSAGGWVGLGFSKCTGGSVENLLPAPQSSTEGNSQQGCLIF